MTQAWLGSSGSAGEQAVHVRRGGGDARGGCWGGADRVGDEAGGDEGGEVAEDDGEIWGDGYGGQWLNSGVTGG